MVHSSLREENPVINKFTSSVCSPYIAAGWKLDWRTVQDTLPMVMLTLSVDSGRLNPVIVMVVPPSMGPDDGMNYKDEVRGKTKNNH